MRICATLRQEITVCNPAEPRSIRRSYSTAFCQEMAATDQPGEEIRYAAQRRVAWSTRFRF